MSEYKEIMRGDGWIVAKGRYFYNKDAHILDAGNGWRLGACEKVARQALNGNEDALLAVMMCPEDVCLSACIREFKTDE